MIPNQNPEKSTEMNRIRVLLACPFILISTAIHAEPVEIQLSPHLTKSYIAFLESLGKNSKSAIKMSIYQGYETYGSEIECSNKEGDTKKLVNQKCWVRSPAGFSQATDIPIAVPETLTRQIVSILATKENDFVSPVNHGVFVFRGFIRCEKNVGADLNDKADETGCTLSTE